MGPRPPDKSSIERIKATVGYEPGNCRWATTQEQNWNKSDTRLVTIEGETMPLYVWAKRLNIVNRSTVSARISRGWTEHDALLTSVGGQPSTPPTRPPKPGAQLTLRFPLSPK